MTRVSRPGFGNRKSRFYSSNTVGLLILARYYTVRIMMGIIPQKIFACFSVSMPQVESFVTAVRENETTNIPLGAAGYCWGGKHVVNLAHGKTAKSGKPLIDAAFVAHPSHLAIPDEIEKVMQPLSIAIGDNDLALKPAGVIQIKEILDRKVDVRSEVTVYPGARHGFAVRSNPGVEKEEKQAEEAREQAVNWLSFHFGKLK